MWIKAGNSGYICSMLFKLNVVKQGRSARMKTRIMTSGGQNQSLTKLQGRERLAANRGHPMTSSSTWVSLMIPFSFFHSGATKKIRTVQKTKVEKCWAIWAAHCTHWTGTDLKLEPKMGPKTVIQRAQNTHSASEFCSHWRTYYQFWCANLVLFKNNQVCVPKHPISSSTKHTPFLSSFSLVLHWLLFSPTMTNRWLSLKAYHDKNQALKYMSTARRFSELKWALAQQQHGGHTQPQEMTPADDHRHICHPSQPHALNFGKWHQQQ